MATNGGGHQVVTRVSSKDEDDSFTSSASCSSNEDLQPIHLVPSSSQQELPFLTNPSDFDHQPFVKCDLAGTRFRIQETQSAINNLEDYPTPNMMNSTVNVQVLGQKEGGGGQSGGRMTDSSSSLTDITLDQALYKMQEIERENVALRDNLRQHNAFVKQQYEALAGWRQRENEKFEQTKAVITALKAENQELQVKVMTLTDKESQLSQAVQTLEEEKAHLLRQKAISDQKLFNLYKMAEEQGVQGVVREDFDEAQDVADAMVYVSVSEKEEMIAKLEEVLEQKEDMVAQLRTDMLKKEQEVATLRESTKQMLKDMESQQTLKESIEEENRTLTKQLMETQEKLHKHMQSVIATTKREMQAGQLLSTTATSTATTTISSATPLTGEAAGSELRADTLKDGASGENISFPDNVEDLVGIVKSLEAKEAEEMNAHRLENLLEVEKEAKLSALQEMEHWKTECQALKDKVRETQIELEDTQQKAVDRAEKLAQEYDQKLMEMAKHSNRQETQTLQANETEDVSILRSQVLTLIREVDEAQGKLSAAMAAVSHKDNRILELDQMNQSVRKEFSDHWQESQTLIHNLRQQLQQQYKAQSENAIIKCQHEELQDSFSKLVMDYKELQETFEAYRQQMEQNASRKIRKETMEEINRLTAQVIAADEAIALRDEQVAQLRRELANHAQLDEKVQLFQMQADVYKSDFAAERDARTKLAEEKTRLEEQLNALQVENRTLKEELEGYNQKLLTDMQRRLGAPATTPPAAESPSRLRATPPLAQDYMQAAGAPDFRHVQNFRQQVVGAQHLQDRIRQPAMPPPRVEDEDELQSFQELECPCCNARFPDPDSLQLHVPDCVEGSR